MAGSGGKRWMMLAAPIALAACGGGGDAQPVVEGNGGIPAEVAAQSPSNLAQMPEDPDDLPDVTWRAADDAAYAALELIETDGRVSLILRCGGPSPRLQAVVPSFTPSSAGEPMRLAIGGTEIALADAVRGSDMASVGESVIPPNLPELFAAARLIDVVQGVQRIGTTPAPPPPLGRAFADACLARKG